MCDDESYLYLHLGWLGVACVVVGKKLLSCPKQVAYSNECIISDAVFCDKNILLRVVAICILHFISLHKDHFVSRVLTVIKC